MNRTLRISIFFFFAACGLASAAQPPGALNVKDFGAKGDAKTDDTDSFQKALDEAGKSATRVYVPPARYLIAKHLDIPDGVELCGTFDAPPVAMHNEDDPVLEKGSVLLAVEGKGNANGTPFITLHRLSHLHGLTVFYPEQTLDVLEYPWCIRGDGDNCSITDVLLINPYQAVDFGTKPSGRHYINGLYAQPLKTGLFIDKCFDVGRVENIHFWPFWHDDKKLEAWTREHGTAFLIGRTDWEYMSNCFCIFYSVGYHFIANKDGPGNAVLTQCGSDISPCSVKIDATQDHAGVSFVNGQFMAGIQIAHTNRGPVKFAACGFWGEGKTDSHIVSKSSGQVTLTACHFTSWGQIKKDAPCIVAESGSITVSGCDFLDADPAKTHIELAREVEAAVIMGNHFKSPMKIANHSDGDVQMGLNVASKK